MGYAKQEAEKKQKNLVSKSQRNKRKLLVNLFKIILVMIVTVIIAAAGAGFGMMKGILDNSPSIDDINIVPKGFKSYIYNEDGSVEKEIATINSNRIYVYYEDIPQDYINAFVAIEDERFWTHNGIDVKGILRVAVHGISTGEFDQGASTITQQLIKNNVFNVGIGETTFLDKLERKIQEQYLAMELEKKYSKEEILEYYLNTIYLGRGVHGIQAASEKYFGKDMTELTISEIATIAGITQNPYQYDPTLYPEKNAKRREMVLDKMLENGYITQVQYDEALADDVYARIDAEREIQASNETYNTYYVDAILDNLTKDFMEIYGCSKSEATSLIYFGGYSIYSVQNKDLQRICEGVINDTSYYGDGTKVALDYQLTLVVDGEEVNFSSENLISYYIGLTGNSKYNLIYANEDAARAAADEFKEAKLNETGGTFYAESFKVSPQPQFTFTLIDQKNGYVRALVGGRGEKRENRSFNRAISAERQPGSCFKIVAAYVPYLDACGGSLASPFLDEEYYYANGKPVKNWWGNSYRGYVNVREAIAQSMNVIAVKTITKVTPELSYQYLIDQGFTTLVDTKTDSNGNVLSDINQSTALGGLTYGVTNLEITAAYATIANRGVYCKPAFYSIVKDHDGNVIIDNTTPKTKQVMKETTAWQLIEAMKSVVTSGTGTPARLQTGMTCAGKTGTTSSEYDLWFCGMTPYYTGSIWMGFDYNVDLGNYYGGSEHKRMWRAIMDQIVEFEGQDTSADFFERPEGITTVTLCMISGKLPNEGCPTTTDYCAVDSIPSEHCGGHEVIAICDESKCRATSACPSTQTFAVEIDEQTGQKKLADAPAGYVYTEEVCPLHPEAPEEVTITSSAGQGGSISSSVTVPIGSDVTFYITPATGYSIQDVLVNGVSVGPVSSYTFIGVQDNATISATFTGSGGSVAPPTEAPTTQAPPPTEAPTTQAPTEAPTEAPPPVPVVSLPVRMT